MVFSPWHLLPSSLSALLIIALVFLGKRGGQSNSHRSLSYIMALSAALGLAGYINQGNFRFYPLDQHVLHSWLGLIAFLLSVSLFLDAAIAHRQAAGKTHCKIGYAAAAFALLAILSGLLLLSGGIVSQEESIVPSSPMMTNLQEKATSVLPETEAGEYQGRRLVPISEQGNNALSGTQHLDREVLRLNVTGLVRKNLSFSYQDLLALPAYSELAYMPCVEGWGFDAKWTGFRVTDLLNMSGPLPQASYVVFYSADGYSTGLPLDYLRDNQILLAYGINDVTLPAELGFPLQLVAKSRYGYKWAKWITSIEVVDREVRGYWESRGYSNSAKVGELAFG
ncbi:MAG: molybdopterin-dependent oxidoreductase [Methanothrix sp.]|nr:molybdopterin-dependent oxidoreductase [Methanothrix sp.]